MTATLQHLCKVLRMGALMIAFATGQTVSPVAANTNDSSSRTPGSFIQWLADEIITLLRTATEESDREAELRRVLQENFSLDRICRFVLGQHWREMSPDSARRFGALYVVWISQVLSIGLSRCSGETLTVTRTTSAANSDTLVHSTIEKPNAAAPTKVVWHVIHEPSEGFRIIDVVVDGVSMALTQRSEFQSIIRKHGVDGLLKKMQASLSRMKAKASGG